MLDVNNKVVKGRAVPNTFRILMSKETFTVKLFKGIG